MDKTTTTPVRIIDLTGYETVARARTDFGEVLVVNNNSTHYILATQEAAAEGSARATAWASFPYSPEHAGMDNAHTAYRNALMAMVVKTVDCSQSLRGGEQ